MHKKICMITGATSGIGAATAVALQEAAPPWEGRYPRHADLSHPPGLLVVDPGVGTDRRPLLISTGREFFLGPDNGLFSEIFDLYPHADIRRIDNRDYRLRTAGSTFDGWDVFAPAAAWLSSGVPRELFGPVIHDPVRRIPVGPVWLGESLVGRSPRSIDSVISSRMFGVKMWPNFVFLKDGKALKQLARPPVPELRAAFAELVG